MGPSQLSRGPRGTYGPRHSALSSPLCRLPVRPPHTTILVVLIFPLSAVLLVDRGLVFRPLSFSAHDLSPCLLYTRHHQPNNYRYTPHLPRILSTSTLFFLKCPHLTLSPSILRFIAIFFPLTHHTHHFAELHRSFRYVCCHIQSDEFSCGFDLVFASSITNFTNADTVFTV